VDWSGAALGPPGFDAGWCRLDLYLLYAEHIAGQFLDAYQTASEHALPDPLLWDLWAAARSHHDIENWVPARPGTADPGRAAGPGDRGSLLLPGRVMTCGARCRAPQKRRKNFAGTAAVYLASLASW
jgi:hypothetical protein